MWLQRLLSSAWVGVKATFPCFAEIQALTKRMELCDDHKKPAVTHSRSENHHNGGTAVQLNTQKKVNNGRRVERNKGQKVRDNKKRGGREVEREGGSVGNGSWPSVWSGLCVCCERPEQSVGRWPAGVGSLHPKCPGFPPAWPPLGLETTDIYPSTTVLGFVLMYSIYRKNFKLARQNP